MTVRRIWLKLTKCFTIKTQECNTISFKNSKILNQLVGILFLHKSHTLITPRRLKTAKEVIKIVFKMTYCAII